MAHNPDIAAALADVAREINAPQDLQATLDAIVRSAADTLPGVDHVGISITHRDGRIETMAGTDQMVWELDLLQYDIREGPCYDALASSPVTVSDDLPHDERWPRYVPIAAHQGVRAQMALRLYVEGETHGGLNLYSTEADHIDPEVRHIAQLFATHAALALKKARQEEDLNTALYTRKVFGQALGIVMERYQLDEDRAFQFMVRVSTKSKMKLRDIAQELVDQANANRSKAAPNDDRRRMN